MRPGLLDPRKGAMDLLDHSQLVALSQRLARGRLPDAAGSEETTTGLEVGKDCECR